jgi:TPP-dependent pyruvate/acetoin dehydrogenase alpha subunit
MAKAAKTNRPTLDELKEMYVKMVVTRRMEEGLFPEHRAGNIRGPIHTCNGQEASAIGATAVLRKDDLISTTHRGHGHMIGKGVPAKGILAEIYGRETGVCRGRAGHMLMADRENGLLGTSAIVGGGPPYAVGQALAFQCQGSDRVAMSCFGDGAAQIGMVHEAMNVAGLWKLPVVFLCEHNMYGLTVHSSHQSPIADISDRAAGYDMPGVKVDGNDVVAVYQAAAEAVARARRGDGPTLLETKTYRMVGFSTTDIGGYQPEAEMAEWAKRDPIKRLRELLGKDLKAEELDAMDEEAKGIVDEAYDFARTSPVTPLEDLHVPEYAVAEASHG